MKLYDLIGAHKKVKQPRCAVPIRLEGMGK
jgi:hypothetical protein